MITITLAKAQRIAADYARGWTSPFTIFCAGDLPELHEFLDAIDRELTYASSSLETVRLRSLRHYVKHHLGGD